MVALLRFGGFAVPVLELLRSCFLDYCMRCARSCILS